MDLPELKRFSIVVPEHVYFNFIQKVKRYDLITNDIFLELMLKFNSGDFDELFDIRKD